MHSFFQEIKPQLAAQVDEYRLLEEERLLGWKSEEVDKLWKMRNDRLGTQNHRKGGRGPAYDKYFDFYCKALPQADAGIFNSSPVRRFLDCGCAPGGLVAFLIKKLGWTGIGLSLDPENGGLQMRYHPPPHVFTFSSVSFTSESFDTEIDSILSGDDKFDFLNLGVVIGGHQVEDDESTSLQLLTVSRNSFVLMFSYLRTGGDCLWIFPSTNAGSWLYFLDKLRNVFPGGISLLSTLVPSRSPVYALCRNFDPEAGRVWEAELRATPRPGRECFDRWNYKTWDDAKNIVTYLRTELANLWTRQKNCLKQIRMDASTLANAPERAFTKLSGGQELGLAKPKSSSRADVDDNWRR